MGTLFKYIFYIVLVLLVYIVAKDIYDGKINQDTTVKEVSTDIGDQSEQIVKDSVTTVKKAIN